MTQHILAIQIGPMQQFIQAARRTRDLWYSSWLMSDLSKAVARAVVADAGVNSLIFPAASAEQLRADSSYSVANKIIALVDVSPKDVAERAEQALKDHLHRTMLSLDKGVQKQLQSAQAGGSNPSENKTMWQQAIDQVADLPEFYWAALPFPDKSLYPTVRLKVEALLAARKNCRHFKQVSWYSDMPKSSLNGRLESIIPESYYPNRSDKSEEREQKIKTLYTSFRARPAERLSGVDLLKRLGQLGEEDGFPSTSHMATAPLFHRLQNANGKAKERWEAYIEALRSTQPEVINHEKIGAGQSLHPLFGKADGSLLFESRLRDYFDKKVPKEVKNALRRFYKLKAVDEPIPYYAILLGDGDFMGRALNQLTTPEAHRRFSQILSQFAESMQPLIESDQYGGALIYAGGDDVLALLPLHTAVSCAVAIKEAFNNKMELLIEEINKILNQPKLQNKPTFSAGIAIAHHLEPLEDALALARQAEQAAKAIDQDKNALAISLDKRSGVTRTLVDKWKPLVPNLEKIVDFYQTGNLPHGLPYHLQKMIQELGGDTAVNRDPALKTIAQRETVRIVKRKLGKEMPESVQQFLEAEAGRIGENGRTVTSFINELIIANTLAKAKKQSEGK